MPASEITIDLDASLVLAAIDELTQRASSLLKLDCGRLGETGKFALELLKGAADLGKCISGDLDTSAHGAGAVTVLVKPSELLLDLLSALRAVECEV